MSLHHWWCLSAIPLSRPTKREVYNQWSQQSNPSELDSIFQYVNWERTTHFQRCRSSYLHSTYMAPIIGHTYQARIIYIFFRITEYNIGAHNMHAHSSLWTHVRKPYPYEYLERTEPTDLEIHEITSGEQECHAQYKAAFGNIIWLLTWLDNDTSCFCFQMVCYETLCNQIGSIYRWYRPSLTLIYLVTSLMMSICNTIITSNQTWSLRSMIPAIKPTWVRFHFPICYLRTNHTLPKM
jgi:hypothetical protein